jgi:hypothetical protein
MITLDKFASYLKACYEKWREDNIKAGATAFSSTETAFARDARISLSNWGKLTHGGTRPTDETLAKLAAHPYIGIQVYDALGVARPMPRDPDLMAIAEDWPYLSQDTKRAIVEMARNRAEKQPARVIEAA